MLDRPWNLRRLLPGLIVLLSIQTTLARGAEAGAESVAASTSQRPRIGLVLAGGGAKGGAHVGVLKVLEELHIPIDCIAGTSMGALVGGGYASGIPSQELQDFVLGINWKTVVGGLGQRDLQPIEQKRLGVTYSNTLELGIQKSHVVMAPGLINTNGIEDLLRGFVAKARSISDFDQFPIPYRAIATDMVTGKMAVLDRGDLASAMRASMAIPGAFAPVVTEGQILADGGLVRNIPVDIARQLCADVVIVVNLVEPAVSPERLKSPAQLLSRTMDVMIEANENLQLQSLTAQDVRIDVEMGDIGTSDFERLGETIPLGEAAARRAAPQLARFAVSPQQYAQWRSTITSRQGVEARIADVQVAGLKRVNPQYLQQVTQIRPGDTVNIARISADAQRLSALEDLESVSYELKGDPANPTLEWLPKEKSWGPDFLKADVGLYASSANVDGFILYLQHARTWVNDLGAQWRNEAQVGRVQLLSTSFYQPLVTSQHYFVEPKAYGSREIQDLYNDGARLASYQFRNYGGTIDFGANFGTQSQLRVGYSASRQKVNLETGAQVLPNSDSSISGIVVSAIHDSRDTPFRPTKGVAVALEYTGNDGLLGDKPTWERAELGLGVAVPFRSDVIWINAAAGSDFGQKLPQDRLFVLGGPLSFPGYDANELRASSYWTFSGSYLWKLADIFTLRGQTLYGGLHLQTGQVYQRLDGVQSGQIGSAAFEISGRTPVGPVTLGYALTTTNSSSVWLSLGRPVGTGTILERGIFR